MFVLPKGAPACSEGIGFCAGLTCHLDSIANLLIMFKKKGDNRAMELNKNHIVATSIGNVVEWYEYGVYSYCVGILGANFFPESNPTVSVLYGFFLFALAFFMRPLGGLVFGSLSDKLGRKHILMITILLMSGATFAIGLVPSYESIGIASTVIVMLLRLGQGLACGGEYISANVYINESAPTNRRAMFCSFLESGVIVGYLMAAGFNAFLSSVMGPAYEAWGWRILFVCSLPLALTGVYIRKKLEEPTIFQKMQKEDNLAKAPIKEVFSTATRPIVIVFLINVFNCGAYYTLLTYIPSFFETQVGLTPYQASMVGIAGMLIMLVTIPFFGFLGDRYNKRNLLLVSVGTCFVLAIPLFSFILSGSPSAPLIGYVLSCFILSTFLGVYGSTTPLLFPSYVRTTGFGISYNMPAAIFGGGSPLIITWLVNVTGNNLMSAYYLMAVSAAALIAIILTPNLGKHTKEDDHIAPSAQLTC